MRSILTSGTAMGTVIAATTSAVKWRIASPVSLLRISLAKERSLPRLWLPKRAPSHARAQYTISSSPATRRLHPIRLSSNAWQKIGFTGFDSEKLQAYAFLNVESSFAKSLQQAGIKGITIDNLIALRIFNVDPAYAQSITALGYPLPDADQLIGLKVQGVNAAEVREIRALGYQPTVDELIQIRIFHITPDFIHRMQDRGLKNLTIAKLVQIRIFKLDE